MSNMRTGSKRKTTVSQDIECVFVHNDCTDGFLQAGVHKTI